MTYSALKHLEAAASPVEKARVLLKLPERSVKPKPVVDKIAGYLWSEDRLLRFVAACVLARVLGKQSPSQVLTVFLSVMEDPTPIKQAVSENHAALQIASMDVLLLTCTGVCLVSAHLPEEVLASFMEGMDRYSGFDATCIAHTLLHFTFPRNEASFTLTREAISAHQRTVLETIANSRRAWRHSGNMAASLAQFGLPTTRDSLRAFLAAEDTMPQPIVH